MPPESHPAAKVFPLMTGEALVVLAADIAENGLLEEIELLDGKIIDGRNRLRACAIAGVEPRYRDVVPPGRPIEYVLSKNLRRRQLTIVQLALLAFDLIPYYREDATERQKVGRAGLDEEQEADRGYTNAKVAAIVGIGERTVRRVIAISRADPEVLELMRQGAFETVGEACLAAGVELRTERIRPESLWVDGERDRWEVVLPPLAIYLRKWLPRGCAHVPPEEARRRLRALSVVRIGLDELTQGLEARARARD